MYKSDAHRGYNEHNTTEKLVQSMRANTIGIYYGNTQIEKEFNKKSFIDVRNFSSLNESVERIIELDKNNDEYLEILKTYWLVDNIIQEKNKEENIKSFLYKIFE